jgi:hypothetical protein
VPPLEAVTKLTTQVEPPRPAGGGDSICRKSLQGFSDDPAPSRVNAGCKNI